MTEMKGPLSPSVHGECGLLAEGFDHPPAVAMPYNPPYYPALVESAGLTAVEELYAYRLSFEHLAPDAPAMQRLARLAEGVCKRHPDLAVRRLDLKRFDADVLAIGRVLDAALEENPDHVPFTDDEMLDMARGLRSIADPDLVLMAELAGEPVGCIFGVPDVNPALRAMNGRRLPFGWLRFLMARRSIRAARIIGWGALAEHRRMGVIPLLMHRIIESARRQGYRDAELSWITEDNIKSFRTLERAVSPRLYKRYRIYRRTL